MECGKSSFKSEVHSDTGLSQKKKKNQINNLPLHLKELVGENKFGRRNEVIKIKVERSEVETTSQ